MAGEPIATDQAVQRQGELVFARLYGEALTELPKDLYIPPEALEVFLGAFEGPLDLLLYLIRKANLDVLDIPMAPLTAQYLEYVEAMRSRNLELAAEYLLMAAMLLDIKSRMLLPKPAREAEQDAEDPRAELVRRLIEYERMKHAALALEGLPRIERDFEWAGAQMTECLVEHLPDVSAEDLRQAWAALMRRARLHRHHHIGRESLSVREIMARILRRLPEHQMLRFEALFEPAEGVPMLVVSFLALLELCKESMLKVVQNAPLEPIYVRRHIADV